MPWPEAYLVLRDAWVDLLAPGGDAALDVVDVPEPGVLQELDGLRAPTAGLAVDGEVLVRVELREAPRKLAEWHELDTDVRDLVLVRLAHVENVDRLAVVELLLELFDRDLRHAVLLRDGVGLGDAAELLVVYELRDGRVLAADGAARVLAELHLAAARPEGAGAHRAPGRRRGDAQSQLDRLRRLRDADGAGKDAEDTALGA